MADPFVIGSLISAGSSLLGGLFGKPKKQSAEKNTYDGIMGQARGAREASDRYGFNPLTLLGASSAIGPSTSGNYMGNAIADAGMIVADGLAKRSEQLGQITKLSEENALLKKEIQNATLRPKIAGVYAQRQMTPSLAGALGRSGKNDPMVQTAAAVGQGSGGNGSVRNNQLRPLPETYEVDPRRPADQEDQKSHSGFMVVDNPHLDYPIYVPTMDGDEPLQWYDLPSAAMWGGGSWLKHQIEQSRKRRAAKRPAPKPFRPSTANKAEPVPSGYKPITERNRDIRRAQGFDVIKIGGKYYARHPSYNRSTP